MRWPSRWVLAAGAAMVFAGTMGWAGPVHACTCAPTTPEEAFESSDAIFEGRVVAIEAKGPEGVGPKTHRVVLRVVRSWKGVDPKRQQLTVRTSSSEAACGYSFEPDTSYLVYASRGEGGKLKVSLCSRTRPAEKAREDFERLGAGVTPVDVQAEQGTGDTAPGSANNGGAGCRSCALQPGGSSGLPAAAAVLLALLWIRRRPPR
jgi:hypothetical protein